jgi:hypothetical protein
MFFHPPKKRCFSGKLEEKHPIFEIEVKEQSERDEQDKSKKTKDKSKKIIDDVIIR